MIKNTTQFLLILDQFKNDNVNSTLNKVISFYKEYTIEPLSLQYHTITLKIGNSQKESYNKLNEKNKSINELLSILNNNRHFKEESSPTIPKLKEHEFISKYTVNWFTIKINEEIISLNIEAVETWIMKFNRIITKNMIIDCLYAPIVYTLIEKKFLNLLRNREITIFLLDELKKIYFAMIHIYNINLKNKNKILRSIKQDYTYDKCITSFLESKINYSTETDSFKQMESFKSFCLNSSPYENEIKLNDNENIFICIND